VPLRITIDRELCSGYANCLDAAPTVFDVDEHDIAVVIAPSGEIEMQRAAIERAAKLCPLSAIALEETD